MAGEGLASLVQKINIALSEKGTVEGIVVFEGETSTRTTDLKAKFSYKFLGEEEQDYIRYDKEDDEYAAIRKDPRKVGITLLEYHFRDNIPEINIVREEEDKSYIEIQYIPKIAQEQESKPYKTSTTTHQKIPTNNSGHKGFLKLIEELKS